MKIKELKNPKTLLSHMRAVVPFRSRPSLIENLIGGVAMKRFIFKPVIFMGLGVIAYKMYENRDRWLSRYSKPLQFFRRDIERQIKRSIASYRKSIGNLESIVASYKQSNINGSVEVIEQLKGKLAILEDEFCKLREAKESTWTDCREKLTQAQQEVEDTMEKTLGYAEGSRH
jgi:exonuclease VII small subunit